MFAYFTDKTQIFKMTLIAKSIWNKQKNKFGNFFIRKLEIYKFKQAELIAVI